MLDITHDEELGCYYVLEKEGNGFALQIFELLDEAVELDLAKMQQRIEDINKEGLKGHFILFGDMGTQHGNIHKMIHTIYMNELSPMKYQNTMRLAHDFVISKREEETKELMHALESFGSNG